MTLTKKHWTIIGVVAILVAIYFIFIKKRKYSESSFDTALPLLGENSYAGMEESGLAGVCNPDCNSSNPCKRCAKKWGGKGTWSSK